MSTDILRLVYLALVRAVIQDGTAWGGITKTNFNPFFLLQKRTIKICFHKLLDYPTQQTQSFSEFNLKN